MNLHLLIAENCMNEVELTVHHLRTAGYSVEYDWVSTLEGMAKAVHARPWDLILSHHSMPSFSAFAALQIWKESGLEIPFIVIASSIGEESAVDLIKDGAHDLVLKRNRTRLIPVVEKVLREVSDRRRKSEVEDERIQVIRDLQQALQVRDDFLSIASHELKTPLTPLKLQHQRILKDLEDGQALDALSCERMRGILHQSVRQIDRLNYLVDELLDVSRIRIGRLSLNLRQANLTTLVYDVVERFGERINAAECDITVEAQPDVLGYFDLYRMDGVITNLLDNALKYGRGNPIRIRVESIQGQGVASVQDAGIGIHEKDVQRIFERFERAVGASTYGGLGLGLYISRQVLTAHGGEIRVQSTLGSGSIFTIEFPLRTAEKTNSSSQCLFS